MKEMFWKLLECAVSSEIFNNSYTVTNIHRHFCIGFSASHGTHVASIAAGNHKTTTGLEELDGVAPGAKIVSLTIGDGRLGSVIVFQMFY